MARSRTARAQKSESSQLKSPRKRGSDEKEETVTVSFRFPKVLNRTLKIYSAQNDVSQNELVARALMKFLDDEGIRWDQPPVITWKQPHREGHAAA
jgi:predicted HicB family RNase H-like nuclease